MAQTDLQIPILAVLAQATIITLIIIKIGCVSTVCVKENGSSVSPKLQKVIKVSNCNKRIEFELSYWNSLYFKSHQHEYLRAFISN